MPAPPHASSPLHHPICAPPPDGRLEGDLPGAVEVHSIEDALQKLPVRCLDRRRAARQARKKGLKIGGELVGTEEGGFKKVINDDPRKTMVNSSEQAQFAEDRST